MVAPLFISHAVPWILESAPGLAATFATVGRDPAIAAVIVANAHWQTSEPTIGIFDSTSKGQGRTADRAVRLLASAGFDVVASTVRADEFDFSHSLWTPLSMMFGRTPPPIVTLSVQPALGPAHHLRLGEALRPLTQDVLVLGSGSLIHNMTDVRPDYPPGRQATWAAAFSSWMQQRAVAGDVEALLDYRHRTPHAARSHPQEDHLLPLFVALGASRDRKATVLHDDVAMATVSLTAINFT